MSLHKNIPRERIQLKHIHGIQNLPRGTTTRTNTGPTTIDRSRTSTGLQFINSTIDGTVTVSVIDAFGWNLDWNLGVSKSQGTVDWWLGGGGVASLDDEWKDRGQKEAKKDGRSRHCPCLDFFWEIEDRSSSSVWLMYDAISISLWRNFEF